MQMNDKAMCIDFIKVLLTNFSVKLCIRSLSDSVRKQNGSSYKEMAPSIFHFVQVNIFLLHLSYT